MSRERYGRLRELFVAAGERHGDERARYLDEACGDDVDLRTELEELLAEDDACSDVDPTAPTRSAGTPPARAADERPVPGAPNDGPAGFPRRVGPYRLLEVLGEGGMGTVFVAEQTEPIRRRVALKLIKPGMDSREVLDRFDSERQALALMDHPHIARVYDAGATEQGHPYFVMELVEGVPITTFCTRHRLTIRERLDLFVRVCEAVQHAHQKGVIHRDLKPSNLLVKLQEDLAVPKIIDFGIAKSTRQALSREALQTGLHQVVGTPEYMSPEQADLDSVDLDTRADIYALGVVLHELLVGQLPFDATDLPDAGILELLRRVQEEPPPRLSTSLTRMGDGAAAVAKERRIDVPALKRAIRGDLDWIVLRTLEKDRTRRYSSASELAADIERHIAHEPVLAGPPDLRYRLGKFARRHRVSLSVSAAVIILPTVIGVATRSASQAQFRRGRTETSRALFDDGDRAWREYLALQSELSSRQGRWEELRDARDSWAPVWTLQEELDAWRGLRSTAARRLDRHNRALVAFNRALETAPTRSEDHDRTLRRLREMYWDRHDKLYWGESEALESGFFAGLIESLGVAGDRRRLAGAGDHGLESDPPGAEVFCFRYETVEGRRLPLAFDPGRGLVGRPFLEVESLWRLPASPLRPGDRVLSVAGKETRLLSDFVRAVEAAPPGSAISLRVLRGDRRETLTWRPTPASELEGREDGEPAAMRRDAFGERFGFTFRAYPLDLAPERRVGRTPLRVDLPGGSYLLVLRHPDRRDLRLPLALPLFPGQDEGPLRVRLRSEDEIPPGFVAVPAGPFACGGDPEVDASLERTFEHVDEFFIARLEVTFAEYLEFVNAPGNRPRIDAAGTAFLDPGSIDREELRDDVRPEVRDGEERVWLIPRQGEGLLFDKPGEWAPGATWRLRPDLASGGFGSLPVLGVSTLAALEYARWLTERHGGRWRFRLPDDLEWEKAARGVDRRFFVWGDYPLWSFCRCHAGLAPEHHKPGIAGAYPADESVYGVRDMAGSVSEPTPDRKHPRERFLSLRGGNWYNATDYYVRIANRNGRLPETDHHNAGIRLVAAPAAR